MILERFQFIDFVIPMRILYLLTSLGIGGAERQVTELARRMVQRGHTVALLALRPRGSEEWPAPVAARYLRMRRNPVSVVKGLFQAWQFLHAFSADVIHSHGFHGNLVNRLVSACMRKPVAVATIHNVNEGGWLRMRAYRFTDRLALRTTAVSEAVALRFVDLGAVSSERCVVIRNAVEMDGLIPDPERRRATRGQNGAGSDFIWLAVGRVVPAKDYPTMLRAFAAVQTQWRETQLWIAGESGGMDPGLRALTADLGLRESVRFLGLRRDIPALLDAADAFVMSSAWEGMPLALAEAMAMEKEVVATDVGGVRELTGDAARLVPSRDPAALAAAMTAVMHEPVGERMARGRAARERISNRFNMQSRAEEWESFYRSLLALPR
jgi:glycosyltransferase involved in cell wall biosynthesis